MLCVTPTLPRRSASASLPLSPHPQVRDFVYISDRAYTRDQILNMEKIMLNALRFNLTVPSERRGARGPGWVPPARVHMCNARLLTAPPCPPCSPAPPCRHLQLPGPVSGRRCLFHMCWASSGNLL